jgi:toxin ParE1/3/4
MFIGRQSPAYAAVLAAQVLKAAQSLDELPERGRVVPELERAEVREVFVHRYRLVYRVEPTRITVLALVHGARDFHRAWRSGSRES